MSKHKKPIEILRRICLFYRFFVGVLCCKSINCQEDVQEEDHQEDQGEVPTPSWEQLLCIFIYTDTDTIIYVAIIAVSNVLTVLVIDALTAQIALLAWTLRRLLCPCPRALLH